MRKSMFWAVIAALVVLPVQGGAVAIPDNAQVRKELSSYFSGIAENSPTVLGGLAKSPDTMQAIQQRIATMSESELSKFGSLMAQAPDWKIAPEALTKAFPPEMLDHIRRVGANTAAHVPNGEAMRDDVLSLTAVLKVLPDEKLKELGLDRKLLGSLEETFREMSPIQASMLQQHTSRTAPWGAAGSGALKSLPPAVQRGAAALAEHGPITPADLKELEAFRGEVMALLQRIDSLPPEIRQSLATDTIRKQVAQISVANADTVFMLRHNLPTEMLDTLERNLDFLDRFANMSEKELKDLEGFREDLASALDPFKGDAESSTKSGELLSQLGPAHLALLRERVEKVPEWQTVLPAAYRSLASPELKTQLAAVEGEQADASAVAALEEFRVTTLADIEANGASSGFSAEMLARAREGVKTAAAGQLVMLRATMRQLPAQSPPRKRLAVVLAARIEFGSCFIDLPSPIPDINLDFLCNPIEDLLTTVRDGVVSTVESIVNAVKSGLETAINTVKGALETAVQAVTSTVNNIVDSIKNLANQIWTFIQTVPDKAWQALKAGLNALLDINLGNGVTLRQLIAEGPSTAMASMKTLVGLTGSWWTAVASFTLPAIPCPDAGTHTPFGDVGTDAAARNYGRYKLLIDGIVDMIPDTEISLVIKIPAQTLYMAFDFLGLCLEQASAQADDSLAETRHINTIGNFGALHTFIGSQVFTFTQHTDTKTGMVLLKINTESGNVQSRMTEQSTLIRQLIEKTSTDNQKFLSDEAAEIRSLLQSASGDTEADIADFGKLSLQLAIERSLREGALASFQLMEPQGYLGVVRDIVSETIEAMEAIGQDVRNARTFFGKGLSYFSGGQEKKAFGEFAKAYADLTK